MPNVKSKCEISFVIPAYEEGVEIKHFLLELINDASKLKKDFEVIVLDGNSENNSEKILKELSKQYRFFKYKTLVHPGVCAVDKSNKYREGFNLASGEYIVQMDADGQDVPSEIPKFLCKLDEGFDAVTGWKVNREDPLFYKLSSKIMNVVIRVFAGTNFNDMNNGFKAYRASVAKSLPLSGGYYRFIPLILERMGYSIAEVPVKHRKRAFGKGKFSFLSRFKGLLDFFVLLFILEMNKAPLYLFARFSVFGFLKSIFFFVLGFILFHLYDMFFYAMLSIVLACFMFYLSFILIVLGLIVEYFKFYLKR